MTPEAWLQSVRAELLESEDPRPSAFIALLIDNDVVNGGPSIADGGLAVSDHALLQLFPRVLNVGPDIVGGSVDANDSYARLRVFARVHELDATLAPWKAEESGQYKLSLVLPPNAQTASVVGRVATAYGLDDTQVSFAYAPGRGTTLAALKAKLAGTSAPGLAQGTRDAFVDMFHNNKPTYTLPSPNMLTVPGFVVDAQEAAGGGTLRTMTVQGQTVYLLEREDFPPVAESQGSIATKAHYDFYDESGIHLAGALLDYSDPKLQWPFLATS